MNENRGYLSFLSSLSKRLAGLQGNAALYFAALFVFIAVPSMIFFRDHLAQLTVPMGMLVALALFALATHLVKFYITHNEHKKPAGIEATIKAQKKADKSGSRRVEFS